MLETEKTPPLHHKNLAPLPTKKKGPSLDEYPQGQT
nr:MAG TPA: hypothetical protein [Caudoviricetes sp.]